MGCAEIPGLKVAWGPGAGIRVLTCLLSHLPLGPLSTILPEDSSCMVVTSGIVTTRGQSGHRAEDRGWVAVKISCLRSYFASKPNSPTQILGRF